MKQPLDSLTKRLTPRDQFIDRDTFGITIDPSGQGLFAYCLLSRWAMRSWMARCYPNVATRMIGTGHGSASPQPAEAGWSVEFYLPWSMLNLPAAEGQRTLGFAAIAKSPVEISSINGPVICVAAIRYGA